MSKVIYVDVETTGLVKYMHGIIHIAYIIEIDGQIKKRGQYKIDPRTYNRNIKMEEKALEVNGYKVEQLDHFMNAKEACDDFVSVLESYVDRYDWDDRFTFVGYNANFDVGFVQEWFKDSGYTKVKDSGYDRYGQLIHYKYLDPFELVKYLNKYGVINIGPKENLVAVCKNLLDLELDAHDAVADIEATRDLHLHLVENYLGV